MKAVFFDMDGVLIDSFEFWYRLFNFTLKCMGYHEIDLKTFAKEVWGLSTPDVVVSWMPNHERKEVSDFYMRHAKEFYKYFRIFPSTVPMLEKLKQKGMKVAVLTNTHAQLAEDEIKDIEEYVDLLLYPHDRIKPKPEPDMIFEGLKLLGLKKEDVVFVGDTMSDMRAGKAAGVITIGLRVDGGDRRIEKLEEVTGLIQ